MNARRFSFLSTGVFALLFVCANTVEAQRPIAHVSGGGSAMVENDPNVIANFGVGATLYGNSSARGSFMCMIPEVVIFNGELSGGTLNGDGSVTLTGVASGVEFIDGKPIPYSDCEFEVTMFPGLPGEAYFLLTDCVVTDILHSVIRGHIFIH